MSHSRIFQIDAEFVEEHDYITESDFYESSFIGSVADYVTDHTNRSEDISNLLSFLQRRGVLYTFDKKENSIVFHVGSREAYFSDKFDSFKEAVGSCKIEDFMDSMFSWRIRNVLDDKFDYYTYDKEQGYPETFDEFMRSVTEGKKYYLGATIDYHY